MVVGRYAYNVWEEVEENHEKIIYFSAYERQD